MNWKIGDRAILVNCRIMENEGTECHIIGSMINGRQDGETYLGWPIECATGEWIARPRQLKPIPNTYDGNEATTWDECPFKPAVFA